MGDVWGNKGILKISDLFLSAWFLYMKKIVPDDIGVFVCDIEL